MMLQLRPPRPTIAPRALNLRERSQRRRRSIALASFGPWFLLKIFPFGRKMPVLGKRRRRRCRQMSQPKRDLQQLKTEGAREFTIRMDPFLAAAFQRDWLK